MASAIVLAFLFLLLAIGVPVGFSMGVAGAVGIITIGGVDMLSGVLQTSPLSSVSGYELVTIPMFLLMAEFVTASGIADDLFKAAAAWTGHIRGGLGMATAITGAGFGAMCGTSTAAAAALSSTSLPAMLKQGYDPKVAGGVVAISGTLSMLIPPAVALVIFGLLAQVNIGKLLVGGLIPAFLVMLTIMATVYLIGVFEPASAPAGRKVALAERVRSVVAVWPMLVLMLLVTGVIYTGVATPTEASAIGAFGAFLISVWKRGVDARLIRQAAIKASISACMISTIILGAQVFGYFFALTHVTQDLVAWVAALNTSRWVIVIFILAMYIVLGAFMDQIAILVLTVPVVIPVIVSLGFDPIWFGVIKIVTAEVGMVTPPVGLNCFIVARYAQRPVSEVFRGIVPHFFAHLLIIGVFLAFPQLILWLPSLTN